MTGFRRRSLPPVFPRGEGTATRRLFGNQFNICMLAHLMQVFNRKRGTEHYLSQLFFVLRCFTSVEYYIMPPFNHVHMLTETVNTEKLHT